ncbi:strictosidine synthase [Galbitalea soli]|uniref:Strictosidine synthase n=1 Tax=Galbitalea soli TaxID=1268042 RepID=A0A7C9TQE3_9MICO|nr:strictosidine synthase [Galbitalea soli]NEM91115.1 strictosidine synthase [Galbitalea soli]NYJ29804.1 hypothetical protein [Galbitalea soli]
MSNSGSGCPIAVSKHFTSSIPLWVRTDQPRHVGMDYWKSPHSGIISATPGTLEYRQLHLADINPGVWPPIAGVETSIPADRKIDGVAEVTFISALSPLFGRAQTRLAYQDEVNVFRRTLLYIGAPNWSRWYQVAQPGEGVGARTLVYLRRRRGVSPREFRRAIRQHVVPAMTRLPDVRELRTQDFLPWSARLWNTPNVAHDNPVEQRFHASVILGFADAGARADFLLGTAIETLSANLAAVCSAVHAYEVSETLTFVKGGTILHDVEDC